MKNLSPSASKIIVFNNVMLITKEFWGYQHEELLFKSRLLIHNRTHIGYKPFKCDNCDKTFITRAHLDRHLKIHTGEKPYSCSFCGKEFTTSHQCSVHERSIHKGENPYQCDTCGKGFAVRSRLTTHDAIHNKPKKIIIVSQVVEQPSSIPVLEISSVPTGLKST